MKKEGIKISKAGIAILRRLMIDRGAADLHGFATVFLDSSGRESINMENPFRKSIGKKARYGKGYKARMEKA